MFSSGKNNTEAPLTANRQLDTVIAAQCTIEGDLNTQNSIKLDGRIHGTLRVEGCAVIGESGLVKGDVYAADLLVLGRLEGNVHARRLHLHASAHIQGNIEAETLQVDPGARYQGTVLMRENPNPPQALLPDASTAKPKSK